MKRQSMSVLLIHLLSSVFFWTKKRGYFAVSVAVFDQFSNLNVTFTLYVFSFYFMIYFPIISNTLLGYMIIIKQYTIRYIIIISL